MFECSLHLRRKGFLASSAALAGCKILASVARPPGCKLATASRHLQSSRARAVTVVNNWFLGLWTFLDTVDAEIYK
jgi:hypothetical protein